MAIKGYKGAVNGVGSVYHWMIDEMATPNRAASSATIQTELELPGVKDWQGTYSAYGGTPASAPNAALAFKGVMDDEAKSVEGTAIVERNTVSWNWALNLPIVHTTEFGGNGALDWTGTTDVDDATSASFLMSSDCVVKTAAIGAAPSYATLANVAAARFTYWAAIDRYANSSTSNQMLRAPGNLSWMVDLLVHIEDPDAVQTLNGPSGIQLWVDDTDYWEIEWVLWKRIGPVEIKVKDRGVIGIQYRGMGASFADDSGTWRKGSVTTPGGAAGDLWGA